MTPETVASIISVAQKLSGAGLATFLLLILVGSYKGVWVWGKDYLKLEKERDEWKHLAMRNLGIAEKATRLSVSTSVTP